MKDYKKEDEYFLFNEHDPDLGGKNGEFAYKIQLPTLESFYAKKNLSRDELLKKVTGYGLDPKKQKFDYYRDTLGLFKIPEKINTLIDDLTEKINVGNKNKERVYPDVEAIWEAIESDPSFYEDEMYWMKLQIKRWIQGFWCFIKGKVTYIDGDHYFYLVFFPIQNRNRKDGLPFYRDIDRRVFHALKWSETTTDAYYRFHLIGKKKDKFVDKYFNNEKNAIRFARKNFDSGYYQLERGTYIVEQEGKRTCAGAVWSTRRGQGKTFIAGCKGILAMFRHRNEKFVIQARNEKTAKDDVYQDKVKTPFASIPFFFKPSNRVYESSMVFSPKSKGELGGSVRANQSKISVRTSKMTAVDGNRLVRYLNDESGKDEDGGIVRDYMGTIRETLTVAGEIIGWSMYFSTFGNFEGGGREFFDLFKLSMRHKSNDNGRTATYMFAFFNPAFDGFDLCIDEFGESIIDDPEEPYINIKGDKMTVGAKTYQMAERQSAKEDGDYELYNDLIRNNPWNIREASRPVIATESYDMERLTNRIEYLQFSSDAPQGREVNLEWVGGKMFVEKVIDGKIVKTNILADVIIKDVSPGETGRFKIYIAPQEKNKKEIDPFNDWWMPSPGSRNRFVLGTDPFAFDMKDVRSKQISKGGGVMFMKRDHSVDSNEVPRHLWKTRRTAATYLYRAQTTDEYADDMAKIAVLYNAMVSTETNVSVILKKFREWKLWGYILYLTDPVTGLLNAQPGVRTQGEEKQRLMSTVRDYVKYDIDREESLELCEQILATETPEDLSKNDLYAALGVALMGSESTYVEIMDESSQYNVIDLSDDAMY